MHKALMFEKLSLIGKAYAKVYAYYMFEQLRPIKKLLYSTVYFNCRLDEYELEVSH